jgi:hypothetical protein
MWHRYYYNIGRVRVTQTDADVDEMAAALSTIQCCAGTAPVAFTIWKHTSSNFSKHTALPSSQVPVLGSVDVPSNM